MHPEDDKTALMSQRVIHITGLARNIPEGAVIDADKAGVYHIGGMARWRQEWVGKKVRIIGDLKSGKSNEAKRIEHPVVQLL